MASEKTLLALLFTCYLAIVSKIIMGMGIKKPNPHAQALGRLSAEARAKAHTAAEIASKGGKARAEKLSAAERSRIAKLAVAARERKRAQKRKGES